MKLMPLAKSRVRTVQLACELAGGMAIVAAGFCVARAVGLALLGVGLLLLGNARLG